MVTRTISNASLNTKLIAFSAIVRSLFEYACQVWLSYIEFLIEKIETCPEQRRGVWWIFRLKPLDGVSDCKENNNIQQLSEQRKDLGSSFINKIQFELYNIDLEENV